MEGNSRWQGEQACLDVIDIGYLFVLECDGESKHTRNDKRIFETTRRKKTKPVDPAVSTRAGQ